MHIGTVKTGAVIDTRECLDR